MHPRVVKEGVAAAIESITNSARNMAAVLELDTHSEAIRDAHLQQGGKRPEVAEMYRLQAIADFMKLAASRIVPQEVEAPNSNQLTLPNPDDTDTNTDTEPLADDEDTAYEEEGFSDEVSDALRMANFQTVGDVRNATDEELLAVKGVGPATLTKLRDVYGVAGE